MPCCRSSTTSPAPSCARPTWTTSPTIACATTSSDRSRAPPARPATARPPSGNEAAEGVEDMTVRPDGGDEEGRKAARAEALRQAEKAAAVVQLAGGVAHDLNNLLMTILGNSEMLTAKLEAGTSVHEMATLIEEAAQRAAELTRRLLAVSQRLPLRPQPIVVDRFAAGLLERLRDTLGGGVAIEFAGSRDLRPALADPAAL